MGRLIQFRFTVSCVPSGQIWPLLLHVKDNGRYSTSGCSRVRCRPGRGRPPLDLRSLTPTPVRARCPRSWQGCRCGLAPGAPPRGCRGPLPRPAPRLQRRGVWLEASQSHSTTFIEPLPESHERGASMGLVLILFSVSASEHCLYGFLEPSWVHCDGCVIYTFLGMKG